MNICARRLAIATVAFGLGVSSQALTLTGVNGFPTDEGGNWKIGWYNTYGPDNGKNAYVTTGSVHSGFVNSGNSAATQISIDLSQNGTYRIYAFFDGNEMGSPDRNIWGANLFFNGANGMPGISVFGHYQNAGDSTPAFSANSGQTLNLAANQNVSGSGTLVYRSGGKEVRLTEFSTTKDVFGLDRVNNFALGASGRNDHVTVMTLSVVPEPATMASLGLGALALLRRRRRSG